MGLLSSITRFEMTRQIVLNNIKKRRSTRSFQPGYRLSQDDLAILLEAAVWAPSGHNSQNQRFLIVDEPQEIDRLARLRWSMPYKSRKSEVQRRAGKPCGIMENASALIFVFSDNSKSSPLFNGEYYIWSALNTQNAAASIQNILLMATAMGLASLWVSCSESMNYSRLVSKWHWRNLLGNYDLPPWYSVQGVVAIGKAKHTDAEGFPSGEKKHGVVFSKVERGPIENYVIKRLSNPVQRQLSRRLTLALGVLNWTADILIRATNSLFRVIYRVDSRIAPIPYPTEAK